MRVGLTLPHYDYSFGDGSGPISFSRVAEVAIDAERQGFDSVWMSDHFFATLERFGGDDTRYGALEPLITLAGLAPKTQRLKLGTLVLSAPFRDAFNHPRPLQEPRPPLLVGGKGGPRLLSIAARYAEGWNAVWRWTPEDYRERAKAAKQALERAGRDPSSFRLSLGLFTLIGEDETDVRRRYELIGERLPKGVGGALSLEALRAECLAGTPDEVVERMTRFAELGVSELIVCPAPVWFAMPDASMVELFAEAVLPRLRAL